MGWITSEILIYFCITLGVLTLILLIWNIRLELRVKKLMRGKNGMSLEDSFTSMISDIDDTKKFRKELQAYLTTVEKRLKKSIQGVNNINFNAFSGADSGAKSFATAFVNEHGDGVIISSLNSRDRLSVFTKQISKWNSNIELSEEEAEALTKAKESCSV